MCWISAIHWKPFNFAIYKHLPLIPAALTFQMIWNMEKKQTSEHCNIAHHQSKISKSPTLGWHPTMHTSIMNYLKNGITDACSTTDCCPFLSIVVHCCQPPPSSAMIYFTIDWWYIVKISYSLIYCECTGTGTDGTCTGTDDTGMSFDGTGTGTEGTDSTSTGAYDSGTILSHFHWWILRLSTIQKKSLTHLLSEQYRFKRC